MIVAVFKRINVEHTYFSSLSTTQFTVEKFDFDWVGNDQQKLFLYYNFKLCTKFHIET